MRTVSEEPFNQPVLVMLPPSGALAQENACRAWDQGAENTNVVIKQLQLPDLARALLPRIVEGPEGQKVACHPSWMWREKHERLHAMGTRTRTDPSQYPPHTKAPSRPGRHRL